MRLVFTQKAQESIDAYMLLSMSKLNGSSAAIFAFPFLHGLKFSKCLIKLGGESYNVKKRGVANVIAIKNPGC